MWFCNDYASVGWVIKTLGFRVDRRFSQGFVGLFQTLHRWGAADSGECGGCLKENNVRGGRDHQIPHAAPMSVRSRLHVGAV